MTVNPGKFQFMVFGVNKLTLVSVFKILIYLLKRGQDVNSLLYIWPCKIWSIP